MTNSFKKFLIKNTKYRAEDFIGYLPFVILSKEIFVKNTDIALFLEKNFHIVFKQYVYSSRTLLLAKFTKYIFDLPEEQQKMVIQLFCKLVKNILDEKDNENNQELVEKTEKNIEKPKKKSAKKSGSNNALANWLNNLNPYLKIAVDDLIEKK